VKRLVASSLLSVALLLGLAGCHTADPWEHTTYGKTCKIINCDGKHPWPKKKRQKPRCTLSRPCYVIEGHPTETLEIRQVFEL
jgi:hypothetical protein